MCGLSGVLLHPGSRPPEQWREITRIATANLVFNEERGREASGIAVIRADGSYRLFKAPVPASKLVEMEEYRDVLSSVGEDTVCILGHTRAPTKGDPQNNLNNHPIVAGHVIGIHNGYIENDDELFARLGLPRAGEVDSEIIFRLLDGIDPTRRDGDYMEAVRARVNLLRGIFAVLAVDRRAPTRLLVLKHLRPLCVHYEREWQALFFSSRYLFLRRAFGRGVITEALESGYGYCFDALEIPRLGSSPLYFFEIRNHQG